MEAVELHISGGLIVHTQIPALFNRPEIIVWNQKAFLRVGTGENIFYEKFSYFIPVDQTLGEGSS